MSANLVKRLLSSPLLFIQSRTTQETLYAVPSGGTAGLTTLIVNQIPITAGETLSLDQEKIVLGNGDSLVAISSVASKLVMTLSTLAV